MWRSRSEERGFSGENVAAITAGDVSAIETWLAKEGDALKLDYSANPKEKALANLNGALLAVSWRTPAASYVHYRDFQLKLD